MNVVEPYAKLLHPNFPLNNGPFSIGHGIAMLKKVEACARVSHGSEDAQTEESWERFVRAVVVEHGDWSVVEHVFTSVDFLVDRGISHELVRHRLFSFTQSSTRFINYVKKMPASFIEPPDISDDCERASNGEQVELSTRQLWRHAIQTCESVYRGLLANGLPPQIARSVLPNALSTRIIVTGNLRNWRHFLIMRTTRETHPQVREITLPLLEEFKTKVPILFADIEPMAKQSEGIKRAR